jgi:hypothetical protein
MAPAAYAVALTLVSLLVSFSANAGAEPRFCDPAKIQEYERGNNIPYLKRIHVYQFGKLTLAGLAVGNSDYRYVQSLAKQYGVQDAKSCTWYFNTGNDDAAAAFNHIPLPRPWLRAPSIAKKYEEKLDGAFDRLPGNMLECAREEGFIAMGCDGMKHRGPSVFAALLAYAGCTPEHAMQIANKVWGTNLVAKSTRQAIAAVGETYARENPEAAAELRKIMTTY